MTEDQDAWLRERAYRELRTLCVCVGSVTLAGVLPWTWQTLANRGITPIMGCAPNRAGSGPLIVPELIAVALVVVTRRHAHRWYVTWLLSTATFCLALLAVFFAALASTPSACFI